MITHKIYHWNDVGIIIQQVVNISFSLARFLFFNHSISAMNQINTNNNFIGGGYSIKYTHLCDKLL